MTVNIKTSGSSSGRKARLLQAVDIEIEATVKYPPTVTDQDMGKVKSSTTQLQQVLSDPYAWSAVIPSSIGDVKVEGVKNVKAEEPTVVVQQVPLSTPGTTAAPPAFKSDDEDDKKKKVGLGVGLGLGLGIPLVALVALFMMKRNKQHVTPTPRGGDAANPTPFNTAA